MSCSWVEAGRWANPMCPWKKPWSWKPLERGPIHPSGKFLIQGMMMTVRQLVSQAIFNPESLGCFVSGCSPGLPGNQLLKKKT